MEADRMATILLATGNAAKQAKLRWLIDGLGFDVVTPRDLELEYDPPERGASHREIAASKAAAWADRSGRLAIASDGGAQIPALGASWDSLFTRRAAGEVQDDRARADHLLGLMRGRTGSERDVIWNEAVAVARPGEPLGAWQAQGEPRRLVEAYDPARVVGGFWFPALLIVPRFGKLVADLTPEEEAEEDGAWIELRRQVRPFLAELLRSARSTGAPA
jgi:XTP/dITP diphosphohydrolase